MTDLPNPLARRKSAKGSAPKAATQKPEKRSRFRKIEVRMWGDEKFCRLSPLPPCGQGLWIYLLTGPHTGPIPGLFRAGRAAMAEELNWEMEAFEEAFREASSQGMVKADWKAKVVWIPKAIECNRPESPNVVKSWGGEWELIPECDLKREAYEFLKANIHGLGEAFAKAFDEAFEKPSEKATGKPSIKPSGKAIGNQEQEQEQEQLTGGSVIVSGTSSGIARDDFTPQNEADWQRYFRERHGVTLNERSVHDRAKAWPLFAAWCNAGVTTGQMDAAVAKAQADATEPIAFLPGYVDRVISTMNAPPRDSPADARREQRRKAFEILTGNTSGATHEHPDENVVDVEANRID